MKIDVLSIFPEMFNALDLSIIGRARQQGLIDLQVHDIRPYSSSKHKNTDDYPFGGGQGMLMMAQPIVDAIRAVTPEPYAGKRIYLSPRGRVLNQALARELVQEPALMLLCGHYEGVDQRVIDRHIDMELSVGDYVLTGGELPAMILIDCVSRLIEGVLGSPDSAEEESFSQEGLLEYPQYTRPRLFEGMEVPQVLLDGNHAEIAAWRRRQSLLATARQRPDLLRLAPLSDAEKRFLEEEGFRL